MRRPPKRSVGGAVQRPWRPTQAHNVPCDAHDGHSLWKCIGSQPVYVRFPPVVITIHPNECSTDGYIALHILQWFGAATSFRFKGFAQAPERYRTCSHHPDCGSPCCVAG